MTVPLEQPPVDLLLFEVGGRTFGVDASQVLRVDRPLPGAYALPGLGPLAEGGRALVFQAEEGEGQLRVDAVSGIRPVPADSLRRLPQVAATAGAYSIGVWLNGETPVLLLDLAEIEAFQRRHQTHGD